MRRPLAIAIALLLAPPVARAQHGAPAAADHHPPAEARQYDFLVGQWELVVTPKVSSLVAFVHGQPRLHGSWKAWRALDGWGIEDELRIVDESGNPHALNHALRLWDPAARRWQVATADAYHQQMSSSTAQRVGNEMLLTGAGIDGQGRHYLTRSHLASTGPASLHLAIDHSYDDGRTWDEGVVVIDGKRVAATAAR